MELTYLGKINEQEVYNRIATGLFAKKNKIKSDNYLIQGDNLVALKYLIEERELEGKIDLVYIDPPFATKNTFTITNGRANTISNTRNGEVAYKDNLTGSAFIEFIRQRLILLKRLMSEEGSIYLHIDYKIGHYVKIIMDDVFGIDNFRNDITRIKCNPKNFKRKGYSNIKDLILFYSKSDKMIWNEPKEPYTKEDILRLFPKKDEKGRRYTTVPIHAPGETQNGKSSQPFMGMLPPVGRHWRSDVKELDRLEKDGFIEWSSNGNPRQIIFAEGRDGKRMQDIWKFKDPQYPVYPTEKNSELLDLIIKTSTNEDSYVLDCFCGSGTTMKAAQTNGRKWVGIDQSEVALKATIKKLEEITEDLFVGKPEFQLHQQTDSDKVPIFS